MRQWIELNSSEIIICDRQHSKMKVLGVENNNILQKKIVFAFCFYLKVQILFRQKNIKAMSLTDICICGFILARIQIIKLLALLYNFQIIYCILQMSFTLVQSKANNLKELQNEKTIDLTPKSQKEATLQAPSKSRLSQLEVTQISLKKLKKDYVNPRFEQWESSQVEKIFQIYEELGSQWKLFSNFLPNRQTNSIKNRFYTALRNTFKILFKEHKNIPKKLPHEIPSRDLVRLYQGTQEFKIFGKLCKTVMKSMNYENKSSDVSKILNEYDQQIFEIYTIIYKTQETKNQNKRENIIIEEDKSQYHKTQNTYENHYELNQNTVLEQTQTPIYFYQNSMFPMQNYGAPQFYFCPTPYYFN